MTRKKKVKAVKAWAIQVANGRFLREPLAFRKRKGPPMLFADRYVAKGYCSLAGDKPVPVEIRPLHKPGRK